MSITFNSKKPSELFFGNKSVAAVYRGNKLVWEKIVKHLVEQYMHDQCIEFIPTQDIVLSDITFFSGNNSSDTHARFRVFNEVGLCIAYSAENGVQLNVTLYGCTGSLKTSTNTFGTPTLYAGQTYYINITGPNSDGMTGSKYEGLTGRMKMFNNVSNINSAYSQDAWTHKCDGSATSFEEICQKGNGCYFIWRGSALPNNMKPNEGGENNPYPYLLKRDMSKVKYRFTDSDFNALSDDATRYAFIYYKMGNTPGDEFVMNTSHWNQGFQIDPNSQNRYMTNNQNKIYTLQGSINENHITSMTPVDNEPSSPGLGAIYFKSAANTWTGGVSAKAVVAWNGSKWEPATNLDMEWKADSTYDATNYVEKINDSYAKDFNNKSVESGDKLYYRINGVEIF